MLTTAAVIFTILISTVILFQFCLAMGLPWGEASMGGKYPGKYPPRMRYVALVNMLVLGFIAVIVLVRADLILPGVRNVASIGIWFVVGFSILSAIMNTITPSKIERNIWAPVTYLLLVTSLVVALN